MNIGYKSLEEILSDLSDAINLADAITFNREIPDLDGLGDRLFEDINALKQHFGIDEED